MPVFLLFSMPVSQTSFLIAIIHVTDDRPYMMILTLLDHLDLIWLDLYILQTFF